jgi:uncharacterized cupin superfamily protein
MGARKSIVNERDVDWKEEVSPCGTSRFFRKKLGAEAGGRDLGCTLYRIPSHAHAWPRHYHAANEEALYVLSGEGTLQIGEETVGLAAGDYVALPAGEAYAHRIVNDSEQDLLFLCFSTMVHPDIAVYPDSNKVGVFVGAAPGGPSEESTMKKFFPLDAEIEYWDDE